jgi:hypothetical protein
MSVNEVNLNNQTAAVVIEETASFENKNDIENMKKLLKDSVFTNEEIEEMEGGFLNFSRFFQMSINVIKRNFWSVYFRPFAYIATLTLAFIVLILAISVISSYLNIIPLGIFFAFISFVIYFIVLINFSVRSMLVVINTKEKFLSKSYQVWPVFPNLLGLSVLFTLLSAGFGAVQNISFIGWILSIVVTFVLSMLFSGIYWADLIDKKGVISSFGFNYELVKDKLGLSVIRNIILNLISIAYVSIITLIIVISAFGSLVTLLSNPNPSVDQFYDLVSSSIVSFGISILIIMILGFFYGIFERSANIVNYVNLRLSPKNHEGGEDFFSNYFLKINPVYIIIGITILITLASTGQSNQYSNLTNLQMR